MRVLFSSGNICFFKSRTKIIICLFVCFSSVLALQAVQVGVKFTTTSRRVEEDVESIDLLVMRTGNVEIASIVR